MTENNSGWPVSTTGGKKIGSREAERILKVSSSTIANFVKRGILLRAEPRNELISKQAYVFFEADVIDLRDHPERAKNPNSAAALIGVKPAA